MPLYVLNGAIPDPTAGVISSDIKAVAGDLFSIVKGDLGLGHVDGAVIGDVLIEVKYNQTVTGAGPSLVKELAGISQQIVIVGADRATVQSHGGVNGLGDTSKQPSGQIRIIYDTTDCNGQGTHVFGLNNKKIANPAYVILFHELVHAKHIARGTLDASNPERQARQEENQCRAEHGLELRDVDNGNGGCGQPSGPAPSGSQGLGKFCFIATAAFGSPQAPQVQALRHFRDEHLRHTALGQAFFNLLYSDYYLYSSHVVQLMNFSPQLSTLVRAVLVEPFLDFLDLLERSVYDDMCFSAFQQYLSNTFRRRLQTLEDVGFIDQVEQVHRTLIQLYQSRVSDIGVTSTQIDCPEVIDVVSFLQYLGAVMQTGSATEAYSTWSLVEPLVINWSALTNFAKGDADESIVTRAWMEAVAVWLDHMPVPDIFTTLTAVQLGDDLRELGEHLFISPSTRKLFAERLLRDFNKTMSFDLIALLEQVDYLPQSR